MANTAAPTMPDHAPTRPPILSGGVSAGLGALFAEPFGQAFAACVGLGGGVEGCAVGVVDRGVDVGAVTKEVVGGAALAAVARLPERVVRLGGVRVGGEEFVQAGQQAERGGVPELVDAGAAMHETMGNVPAA